MCSRVLRQTSLVHVASRRLIEAERATRLRSGRCQRLTMRGGLALVSMVQTSMGPLVSSVVGS